MLDRNEKSCPLTPAILLVISAIGLTLASEASAQSVGRTEPEVGGVIGLPMYHDPELVEPESEKVFSPRLTSLWSAALDRPDQMTRIKAAQAITKAHNDGWTDTGQLPQKLTQLTAEDPAVLVRLAAAEALIELDIKDSAKALLDQSKGQAEDQSKPTLNPDYVLTVDPALARWNYQPAIDLWMGRVNEAQVGLAIRRSAAVSLGKVQASQAIEPLRSVSLNRQAPASLRLATAKAVGQIAPQAQSVHSPMDQLRSLVDGSSVDRLVAAAMLYGAGQDATVSLLDQLITHPGQSGAVIAEAARSLLAAQPDGPRRVVDHGPLLKSAHNPAARVVLVKALTQLPERTESTGELTRLLSDPSVRVRSAARTGLMAWSTQGHAGKPATAAQQALDAASWRGREQGALLVGSLASQDANDWAAARSQATTSDDGASRLDREKTAQRLIDLLEDTRPEVRLAAAHALFALEAPSVLPAMLERARALAAAVDSNQPLGEGQPIDKKQIGWVQTQLFTALGRAGLSQAEPLLRKYLPKGSPYWSQARGAALYALGNIHEGALDSDLAKQFAQRLSDVNPLNPEVTTVRRFAAIGLGRMGAENQLNVLRRYADREANSVIGEACRWAITRITGKPAPKPEPGMSPQEDYFLTPMDSGS